MDPSGNAFVIKLTKSANLRQTKIYLQCKWGSWGRTGWVARKIPQRLISHCSIPFMVVAAVEENERRDLVFREDLKVTELLLLLEVVVDHGEGRL